MLLSVLVLAATLDPSAQSADAVKSAEMPATQSGVSQSALEAGFAAFKKRRFAEAEVDFRKAMDADPRSAGPYFYLGYTYYKLAERKRPFHPDKEKAKELFAKAYELDPTFRPVWSEARAKK